MRTVKYVIVMKRYQNTLKFNVTYFSGQYVVLYVTYDLSFGTDRVFAGQPLV